MAVRFILLSVLLCGAMLSGGAQAASKHMVVAAHPLAADAGLATLEAGGNAMDAAVAVQAVLSVVEPQESGLGGGGFLLYQDAATGTPRFYDGRETAPSAAGPERFLVAGRWPLPHPLAVVSGRAVGVPGLIPMLYEAHGAHGRLPWSSLFAEAVDHARRGVPMQDRLQGQLRRDPSLGLFAGTRPWLVAAWGDTPRLESAELADVLERVAEKGPEALQTGTSARAIVESTNAGGWLPGDLSMADIEDYRPIERQPVCGRYRSFRLCGAAPPSSGGIALLQILGILERFDLSALQPGSLTAVHLIAEASRLAFADRQRYVGDPDFVDVPVAGLIDADYLQGRAALLSMDQAMVNAPAGAPGTGMAQAAFAPPRADREQGTTHFSIVDADGNAVALSSSIEAPFGSRRRAEGYLLNNQLTDFDFLPRRNGGPVANAVAPGKRPRSSMSPTFVFDANGDLLLVVGSRGGSRIIGYVLKTLIGVLDWNLPLSDAVALPNFLHRGERLEIEADTALAERAPALRALGHEVEIRMLDSGLHGIERVDGGWRGAADPRMEGAVRPANVP